MDQAFASRYGLLFAKRARSLGASGVLEVWSLVCRFVWCTTRASVFYLARQCIVSSNYGTASKRGSVGRSDKKAYH